MSTVSFGNSYLSIIILSSFCVALCTHRWSNW